MRLLHYSCLALVLAVCLAGCSGKEKKTEVRAKGPNMTLEQRDTTEVYQLTKSFLELLKAKEIDKAVSMLYFLDADREVVPLPDSLVERQKSVFRMFPVLNYKIESIIFNTETDSQVKYTVEFFKKQPGDTRPNTTSFFIKPMRVNGQWFLTMFDSNTNNGGQSGIRY